ncbi:MAG: hypothetical protein ABSH38_00895 [Verrucomicrobiota bacterium]|jgi:hypothetical protein
MRPQVNKPTVEIVAAWLASIGRKIDRARALADKTEELLYGIACEFDELRRQISPVNPTMAPRIQRRRPLVLESMPNAGSVTLVVSGDGSSAVSIDGRTGIPLTPLVTALLRVLKADCGLVNDHLVGWKSVDVIQAALKEYTRQQHSKAAVKELVYRLRNLLDRQPDNSGLVQTNHRLGYRFAVRRRAPGSTTEHDDQ